VPPLVGLEFPLAIKDIWRNRRYMCHLWSNLGWKCRYRFIKTVTGGKR